MPLRLLLLLLVVISLWPSQVEAIGSIAQGSRQAASYSHGLGVLLHELLLLLLLVL